MAASHPLPSETWRCHDIVCADCGWRMVRLSVPASDTPESPEVRRALSRQFSMELELHRHACAGVVLIPVPVTGLPPSWRLFTEGDLERLSLDLYGGS